MTRGARHPALLASAQALAIGAALVVAGLHTAATTASATTRAAYQPPAFVVSEPTPDTVHTVPAKVTASAKKAAVRRTTIHRSQPATAVRPTPRPATRPATHPVAKAKPVNFSTALAAAVAKIPTYRAGSARWVVSRAYDFWGTADWYHDVLYVSPDVPLHYLYDVAVHEWSHELSVLDYAGDVAAATKAMNAWFGGSGLTGAERAADCMAILQGATWTHYTTCQNAKWKLGAQRLVRGDQLVTT
jgi:hypothetical protein